MDLVSSPQLLEQHEVIPPCEPHAGPNGQAYHTPLSRRQHHRAFAEARALTTSVDRDGVDLPPVLCPALLPRASPRHPAHRQRDPGQQPHGCPDTRHGHPSMMFT
jgi:hypothetical protein